LRCACEYFFNLLKTSTVAILSQELVLTVNTFSWLSRHGAQTSSIIITVPSKNSGQFVKLTKSRYLHSLSQPMQYDQFAAKQVCLVSNNIDLRLGPTFRWAWSRSILLANVILDQYIYKNVRKYFHFVREILEGTVCARF